MIRERLLASLLIIVLLQPTALLRAAQESKPTVKPDGQTVDNPLPRHKGPCDRDIKPVNPQDLDIENLRIFDDAVMQQQLETNFARIAAISGVDQATLISHLGNVSGMNQTFSGLAFSVQGPSTNSVVSTAGAQNVQTIGTTTVSNGTAAGSSGTSVPVSNNQTVTQTTANPATLSTATTQPSVSVPVATPAAAPTAVTSGFSVQSTALLSEQMQLVSRLNTELLEEEGALSDRLVRYSDKGGKDKIDTRPRATIGFDATMMPGKKERNAAVIVDLFVAPCQPLAMGIPPAVTALLPSEETFNVASVRNSSTSIGAGIATQFLGASGSFLFGHNQYFLVQDVDVLAQLFTPSDKEKAAYCAADPDTPESERYPGDSCLGIRWTVRPVLGKPTVSLDRRKFFAQIAFPTAPSIETLGVVTIRTQWRHFDQKTGIIGDELKHSTEGIQTYKIDQYRLENIKPAINSVEDLGNGQVVVRLEGSYFSGTYVRIGNSLLVDAPSGLVREPNALRFVASASDLMTKQAYLVSRSGEQTDLAIPLELYRKKPSNQTVRVSTLDATYSHVSISYCEQPNPNGNSKQAGSAEGPEPGIEPMLLLIAGKVYGLSDAPVDHDSVLAPPIECKDDSAIVKKDWEHAVGVTVPTSVLTSSPFVMMGPLLAKKPEFRNRFSLYTNVLSPLSQPDKLVVVGQRNDGADFLLYGNRLDKIEAIDPSVQLKTVDAGSPEGDTPMSLKALSLSKQQLSQYKFLVVTRKGEGPEAIAIPDTKLPETAGTPSVAATVLKDDDTATVTGDGLNEIDYVTFKGVRIPCTPAKDGKSAILSHLRRAGVTTQALAQNLDFYFKRRPVTVKMDVYTQKVISTAAPATK